MIEDVIDLRSTINLLKRQKKTILSVVVLVFAFAAAFLFAQPPKYTASALIQVSPAANNILSDGGDPQNFSINNVRVAGEMVILRSDAVALRVVDAANLVSDVDFGTDISNPNAHTRTLRNFQNASAVTRKGQTYLLMAEVTASDADRAAELVNIWVESYVSHQISVKIDALQQVADLMTERQESAQIVMLQSEAKIDAYIFDNIAEISDYTGQPDLKMLSAEYSNLQTALQAETALQPDATAADAQTLLAEIEGIRQSSTAGIAPRRSTSQLRQEIRNRVLKSDLPLEMVTAIYTLQQEANIARIAHDTILERRRALALQADLQIADSRLISPALPPLIQSRKGIKTVLLGAVIAAIFLSIGLAFINENWVGGFVSDDQLRQNLAVRVAARVPAISVKSTHENIDIAIAQNFLESPNSAYAESIRRLRVTVDQSLARQSDAGNIIMVTSSLPGEGKSNTSLALARAYAQSGKSTLLVDCDFRKPKLHKLLLTEGENLLFQTIGNTQPLLSLTEIPVFEDQTNLKILLGEIDNPALNDQIFATNQFQEFLHAASQTYDFVILDTPPLLPIIDSAHLAALSDVIALSIKWASTRQHDVRRALKILKDATNADTQIIAFLNQEKIENDDGYNTYFTP